MLVIRHDARQKFLRHVSGGRRPTERVELRIPPFESLETAVGAFRPFLCAFVDYL
jgi:hypothetical protein